MKSIFQTLLFVPLFLSSSVYAAEHHLESWNLLTFQGPTDSSFRFYFEVQPRFGGELSHTERVLIRPALYYQVSPALSLWLGYAWTPALHPSFSDETRIWQQGILSVDLASIKLIQRLRVEQRFIQNTPASHRLRYMIRAERGLHSENRDWLVVVYDEIFLNFHSPSAAIQPGFDQNRIFLGVNHAVHANIRMELGYMNNVVRRPAVGTSRMNHIIMLASYINF